MTNKKSLLTSILICGLLCCILLFLGCEEAAKPAVNQTEHISSSKLLQMPLRSLETTIARRRIGKIQLPKVEKVQILWRDRRKKEHFFNLYRDGRSWWAVELRNHGESWGYALKTTEIKRMLKGLNHLVPVERSEFAPQNIRIQVSLFAANKRFLMRMIQAPNEHSPTAIYHGEWLVYHHGSLYQQAAKGALGRIVPRLVRRLRRLSRRRDGMLLPLHSTGMDFRRARALAKQLHAQRLSLRRCFKKRRFPSSIGPLRMNISFLPSGKVKKLRILTRAHAKHKVVWCVWWFAKKFKLEPFEAASIEYNLVIPPSGP